MRSSKSFLVPQHTPPYEIQRQVRKKLLIYPVIVISSLTLVILIIRYHIRPSTMQIYQEFNIQPPAFAQYNDYFSIGAIIFASFITLLLTRNPQYTSEPVEGGFLKITPHYPKQLEPIIMTTLGVVVGLLVFSTIFPIFSLTSSR